MRNLELAKSLACLANRHKHETRKLNLCYNFCLIGHKCNFCHCGLTHLLININQPAMLWQCVGFCVILHTETLSAQCRDWHCEHITGRFGALKKEN